MAKDAKGGGAETAKIDKAIREAEKGLTRAVADLTKALTLLKQKKFTAKRAKVIAAKTQALMKRHSGVTKLQAAKGFDELPEETQAQITWIDALMNQLLKLTEDLPRAVKLMKKSPEGDYKILIKASKEYALQVQQAPKHVGVLVKEVKKGIDANGPNGPLISLLPMILLVWLITDTIVRGLRNKP